MSILQLHVGLDDEEIRITANSESKEKSISLDYEKIKEKFELIYNILENLETKNEASFFETINELSNDIIYPFEDLLEKSDHINFYIDTELVRYAFDLLEITDKPLFLTHLITYTISDFEIEKEPELIIEDAVIIADKTCDPENAAKTLSENIENSLYKKMEDTEVEEIIEESDDVSLLLISAHGDLEDDNSGEISINDESLTGSELEDIDCSIVYFDSCQMGINTDFLEAFSEEGSTNYYLAPIISNDAGDSSTKTILWFFENLKDSENPAKALFETKKKLYQFYENKGLDKITVLNKAFPFRLYEFDIE
ncbi:MAG: hypothetical protein KDK36_16500 [Leptospiraceae bacterium]|nr:hypothetical protein [Leptospiraceae bacterium]